MIFFFKKRVRKAGRIQENSRAGWMVDLFDKIDQMFSNLNNKLQATNKSFKSLHDKGEIPAGSGVSPFEACQLDDLDFHKVCLPF